MLVVDELLKILEEKKIKQKDLCNFMGLSQSYVSELINGKKDFSIKQIEMLCEFLGKELVIVDKYRY